MGFARVGVVLIVALMACGTNGPRLDDMNWVYAAIRPPMVVQDGTSVNVFKRWWEEAEDCLGMRYEFRRVRWIVIHTDSTFKMDGRPGFRGLTVGQRNGAVTILLAQSDWMNPDLIRHESVHAITGMAHGQLPEEVFDRCSKGGTDGTD